MGAFGGIGIQRGKMISQSQVRLPTDPDQRGSPSARAAIRQRLAETWR